MTVNFWPRSLSPHPTPRDIADTVNQLINTDTLFQYNVVNVKLYGAKGDGVTDDTAAFQKAIAAGNVIHVPSGNYNVSTLTGGSAKYWIAEEALNAAGTAPLSLPGNVDSVFSGRNTVIRGSGGADETALVQISRSTSYTGGTAGHVGASLYVTTTTVGPEAQYEWVGLFVLDNSATAGQNVAVYAKSTKQSSAGPTWAIVTELRDKNTSPASGVVSLEVGLFSNGADASGNRVGIDVSIGRDNGAGTANTTSYGVRVGPTGGSSANATIVNAFYTLGNVTAAFKSVASGTVGVDMSGATLTGSAYRMARAQTLAWEITDTVTTTLDGAVNVLKFMNSTNERVGIDVRSTPGLRVNAALVVGAQSTGWSAFTGTPDKGTVYDTSTVTLPQLAGRVAAIQAALSGGNPHGLLTV